MQHVLLGHQIAKPRDTVDRCPAGLRRCRACTQWVQAGYVPLLAWIRTGGPTPQRLPRRREALRSWMSRDARRARCSGLLGVVLDQAGDELVDRAGLGQVALAGLVGELGLVQALVARTGVVLSLLVLEPLGLGGLGADLALGLLGLVGLV